MLVGSGRAAEHLESPTTEVAGSLAGVVEQHPADPGRAELLGDVHREAVSIALQPFDES